MTKVLLLMDRQQVYPLPKFRASRPSCVACTTGYDRTHDRA